METGARRVDLDGVEHHDVELPGVRLHVVTAGSGSPVLLLHGSPQTWWEYHDVIGPLAQHHRVICPDLRGSGESEAPRSGYDRDTLLGDLVGLLDHFGLDHVGVVAHDWSAMLAFQFGLDHPDRLDWLVAMSVPHPWARLSPALVWNMRRSWHAVVSLVPGLVNRLMGSGSQPLACYEFRGFAADPSLFTEEVMEPYLAPLRQTARQRAVRRLYTHYILPTGARFMTGRESRAAMVCPVVLLTGAADPVIDLAALGGFEGRATMSVVAAVPGAGHWVVDERPDVVVAHALALGAAADAGDVAS